MATVAPGVTVTVLGERGKVIVSSAIRVRAWLLTMRLSSKVIDSGVLNLVSPSRVTGLL